MEITIFYYISIFLFPHSRVKCCPSFYHEWSNHAAAFISNLMVAAAVVVAAVIVVTDGDILKTLWGTLNQT